VVVGRKAARSGRLGLLSEARIIRQAAPKMQERLPGKAEFPQQPC